MIPGKKKQFEYREGDLRMNPLCRTIPLFVGFLTRGNSNNSKK